MTLIALVALTMGCLFVGTAVMFYMNSETRTLHNKGWADTAIESSFNRVQLAAEPIAEQAVDWALKAFHDTAHQIGVSTGHWLPGHHQECEVCIQEAKDEREQIYKAKQAARVKELLSHIPFDGMEFPAAEEITMQNASGEVIVSYVGPPIHVVEMCQTCAKEKVAKTVAWAR